MTKILIIEDDTNLSKILSMELSFEQYETTVSKDGLEGLEVALKGAFDIILVDLMLPSLNGFEITRRIRLVNRRVGIIVMTAKDSLADTVRGLDSGADDYLSKPFAIEELLARIRVVLRRNQLRDQVSVGISGESSNYLPGQPIYLDEISQTVTWKDTVTKLSPREFLLLDFFVKHENELLTRPYIYTSLWKKEAQLDSEMTIVDVYVRHLRNKIEKTIIKSVYGKGYIFGEME